MDEKTFLHIMRRQRLLLNVKLEALRLGLRRQSVLQRVCFALILLYYQAASLVAAGVYKTVWSLQLLATSITVIHAPLTTMKCIVKTL